LVYVLGVEKKYSESPLKKREKTSPINTGEKQKRERGGGGGDQISTLLAVRLHGGVLSTQTD